VGIGEELAVLVLAGLAAFTQAISGFGFSLLIVPPLAMLLGPKEAVVLGNTMGMVVNAATLARMHDAVDWGLGLRLFAAAAVGMPIGLGVLILVAPAPLQVGISLVVLASTLAMAAGVKIQRPGLTGDITAGLLSGILNTSTSMSGPPLVIYLQGRGVTPGMFRATLTAFFMASGIMAASLFLLGGRFTGQIALLTLISAPALLGGWLGGHRLFHRLTPAIFRVVVLTVLFSTALIALVAAATGMR
jgi:uncharacterized membrane protein YfcA